MDIMNKKLSDDEFYAIRKEILGQWPTGKDVDFDESIEYHKSMPESKSFSRKLAAAKKERKTLIQPRAGVALIDEHIKLLQYLQDKGKQICFLLPSILIPDRTAMRKQKTGLKSPYILRSPCLMAFRL